MCDEVGGEGGQYRGAVGTATLASISAMALTNSSELIKASLLLPDVLEMFIRTHITCAVRVLYS